ncbi:MAG: nucleotidyltransferase family protein [Methylovulum sp.]|nr:nucleotidyltransferase family protein [Methylovulum sp.]
MNTAIDNVYAIILAAGASSRMGSPKQLLKWRDRPLLEHTILNARALLDERIIVVLGANAEPIQAGIDLGDVTAVINPDWQEGMASSLRTGIQTLPASASAALILLCDQPLINAAHIQNLLQGWQQAPSRIVASQYHHSVGVPVLFPAEFFEQLSALKGDRGAKFLLMKFANKLLKIPLSEAELDIDNSGDFEWLTRHYSQAGRGV